MESWIVSIQTELFCMISVWALLSVGVSPPLFLDGHRGAVRSISNHGWKENTLTRCLCHALGQGYRESLSFFQYCQHTESSRCWYPVLSSLLSIWHIHCEPFWFQVKLLSSFSGWRGIMGVNPKSFLFKSQRVPNNSGIKITIRYKTLQFWLCWIKYKT